ncbi:MAG TPA: hypothetical protein VII96_13180 [Acidimicrobiales bacterium]
MTVIRRSSDRSELVLTGLSAGPKHGYALIKDIQPSAGVIRERGNHGARPAA